MGGTLCKIGSPLLSFLLCSLCTPLQLWLEKNTKGIDVCVVIAPLFVLYDLRLVSAHLYSDDDREKLLKSCCTRLGLAENERNYIVIANTLIDKLDEMYEKFIRCLLVVNERGE